jgi:hypothetical protein
MDLLMPKKPALPSKPMSWWNDELEDMKSRLKKLDINKNKTQEGKQAYQELKNEFKKAIKASKEASWQKFCTNAESTKDVSNLIKVIEGNNRLGRISILKSQNTSVITPQDSLQCLLEAHFENHTVWQEEQAVPSNIPI